MDLNDLAVMAVGFGFFLTVFLYIMRDHREARQERLAEMREFGVRLPPIGPLPDDPSTPEK